MQVGRVIGDIEPSAVQRGRHITEVHPIIPPHFVRLGDIAGAGGINTDNAPHRGVINILFAVRCVNPFVARINDNGGVNAAQAQLKTPHHLPSRLFHGIDAAISITADDVRLSIHLSDNRGRVGSIQRPATGRGYPNELACPFIKGEIAMPRRSLFSPTRIQVTDNHQMPGDNRGVDAAAIARNPSILLCQ